VELFGETYPNAFFVQIGANDGYALDPLRVQIERREWRGILVEPVPYVFSRLVERYGNHPRLVLEQAAIAERNGMRAFYYLREASLGEDVWPWYHALGSFKREVVMRHRPVFPDFEERLTEAQVPCLTLDALLRKHNVEQIDLLQMDTEGYDYELLRHLDLTSVRPRMIIFEYRHMTRKERRSARRLLAAGDYLSFEHDGDTAALDVTRQEPGAKALRDYFGRVSTRRASRRVAHASR
jgi:FkbM family methyltransferase